MQSKKKPKIGNIISSELGELSPDQLRSPEGRVYMGPAPGFKFNPLLRLPRKMPCPCQSQKKFKTCCLPKLPPVIRSEDAEMIEAQMGRPNLTFVFEESERAP